MSFWSRPRNLVILGGVLVGAAFIPTPGSKTTCGESVPTTSCLPPVASHHPTFIDIFQASTNLAPQNSNVFETQGSKNIGARWSAGGGSDVHTPGVATTRGNAEDTQEKQDGPSGINTEHFKENQASQRPGEPGPFDKAWNKSHYGTDKGK
ncbi:hypothetical protein E4T39_08444 [Aureobasidium subglaciale]|nr:hypothetical protein E4T39_08444 [Aureobasidium subglaciale]